MANAIKYTTGSETVALKKGNFYIGTGDVGKGPTNSTGYYNGVDVPLSGYTIYVNNGSLPGGLSYFSAANDIQLISYTNNLANTSYTSATECLTYYSTQTDKIIFNRNYESISTSGMVFCLDAGFTPSYPTSGTTWDDLTNGVNNGTLTNGPTFNSSNGGSIVFDGIDDYTSSGIIVPDNGNFTLSFWMYYLGGSNQVGIISTWDTSWNGIGIATSNYNNNNVWSLRSWTNNGAGGGMNWGVLDNLKNTWSYITLTYIFSSKTQYYYINGTFQNSETFGSSITNSTLQIARGGQTNSAQLTYYPPANLRISNLQVYNRALTATEITQNYNAQKSRFGL